MWQQCGLQRDKWSVDDDYHILSAIIILAAPWPHLSWSEQNVNMSKPDDTIQDPAPRPHLPPHSRDLLFWVLRVCSVLGRDLFLHQKIFFLHQTGPAGFSRFCTKIIFFSHQLGFFPAPKQFFSAPNDFGNCIWFCTKLILFLHQNDTKSLEAGTKLFWFCTKYFLDFFWFSTKYIPILHQFVTN